MILDYIVTCGVILLAFIVAFLPMVVGWIERIPYGLKYSKWRVVKKQDGYWVEFMNILGFWTSYWSWYDSDFDMPFYDSEREANQFIEKMNGLSYFKEVCMELDY